VGCLLEFNLEEGMPIVDVALRRLTAIIHREKALGTKAIKIIHGYGSSGTGGRIRTESRKYLSSCQRRGLIRDFIPGEELSIFSDKTRNALAFCPDLSKDRDLERHNNGITVILL
jgi:hypothetical protein